MYQFKYDISLENQFLDKSTRGNITTLKKIIYFDQIIVFVCGWSHCILKPLGYLVSFKQQQQQNLFCGIFVSQPS